MTTPQERARHVVSDSSVLGLRQRSAGEDLGGKTAFITGANSGIGRATAVALAERGARVWIACRSADKGDTVASELSPRAAGSISVLQLDLTELQSVRACAASFLEREETLDILVNNAGIAWREGGLTRDGFELFFGVNHLGHFLLTELLLPTLLRAPAGRVVNVASQAHYETKTVDWDAFVRPTVHRLGRPEYCVSKLCNVLHAKELARRYEGTSLRAYSLHPGVVASGVWRGMPLVERWSMLLRWLLRGRLVGNREGSKTTVHCAVDALPSENGLYFDACRPVTPSALAMDPALARNLWERSAEWSKKGVRSVVTSHASSR